MGQIKGITITLFDKVQTGTDAFNKPIFKENPVEVENVLVAPASADDVVNGTDLEGRKAVYTMAIPKGDTHVWENRTVEFFGNKWTTFGIPLEGIETMLPLDWNKKVMVERYE